MAFPRGERTGLIDRYPDVFSVTNHYRNYDNVLLSLVAVDEPLLRRTIEGAWRLRATKKLVAGFNATPGRAQTSSE